MVFRFLFTDFDSGLGNNEAFDALSDIQQGVLEHLRQNRPAADAMIRGPGRYVINVIDPIPAFILRKEVWKQLPKHLNADRQNLKDWDIQPSPAFLKPKLIEKPFIETSKDALPNGKIDEVDEEKWVKTWKVTGEAVAQPHFRFFSNIMISALGNHTSASDPNPHVTLRLRNHELETKGQVVIAHVYHDELFNYAGHRIFIGSPVDKKWTWDEE
ncbi:hypothetical protein FGADI_12328 [Fusarium gaditjirri]|uniref:Uncharacterized protein n=1 Tax=Fusarium gaditjirri TaxID=282569 RepID=A0A8H4SSV2_9HYPO|nr:hypothetical protein FGADI_12328 [Fusarium gaditjirri]